MKITNKSYINSSQLRILGYYVIKCNMEGFETKKNIHFGEKLSMSMCFSSLIATTFVSSMVWLSLQSLGCWSVCIHMHLTRRHTHITTAFSHLTLAQCIRQMREGPYTVANYSSLLLLIPHICWEEKVRCVCNKTSTKHARFKLLRSSRKSRRNVRSPTLWSKVPKILREKHNQT